MPEIRSVLTTIGLPKVLRALARPLRRRHAKCFRICCGLIAGKRGLEIGGPSPAFRRRGVLPVYARVGQLDNCNFSHQTTWEGTISEGATFQYHPRRPPGWQYVTEAADLTPIPAETYDFVLSSHTLEHIANPLRALTEWQRVLRPGGCLALIVPHKDGTFDHRRPVTTLDHLLTDFERHTTEADLTHLPEILALHDLSRDPWAGGPEAFRSRSERNLENRCLHQHVFTTELVVEMLDHMGWQIHAIEPRRPFDILALARKCEPAETPRNQAYLGPQAAWRQFTPFPSDHEAVAKRAA